MLVFCILKIYIFNSELIKEKHSVCRLLHTLCFLMLILYFQNCCFDFDFRFCSGPFYCRSYFGFSYSYPCSQKSPRFQVYCLHFAG